MQPHPQHSTAPPPRVFNYSLDWRFLLPMADPKNVCLLFEENADFSQTLEQAGLHVSQKLSLSDLKDRKTNSFHSLVMPFGLPVGWTGARHKARVAFYFSVRRFIDSGGHLLVGFNNVLNWRVNSPPKYYPSTPRRIAAELKQAGFKSVKIFGAMPDLQIPEYIFDLDPRAIQFALQNRFRRKPAVLQALQFLSVTVGWKRASHLLPCYFAVATP
jgi:hypothetical protein